MYSDFKLSGALIRAIKTSTPQKTTSFSTTNAQITARRLATLSKLGRL